MKEENRVFIETPAFTGRNVPIMELSKAIGKDAQFIRIGLQKGILTFGYALKKIIQANLITIVLIKKYGKKQAILKAVFRNG